MKKIKIKNLKLLLVVFLSTIVTLGGFSVPALVYGEVNNDSNKNYVEGEILVKYKKDKIDLDTSSGKIKSSNFNISNSLEKKENLEENNISVLKIKDGKTVEEKISELINDPNVLYAEPNYKLYPSTIDSNDTYKGLLWGLDNTHQIILGYAGLLDADIDAPETWDINEGASTIVAVIDSGVAYNHPDLSSNMWDGTNCKDDTGVAIIGGCNHGYDYESNDNTPLPNPNGEYINHGTHIAGIIAATKNNGVGVIGVAPNAKIMAIKFGFTVNDEIKAINFAIQNGVKIINASYGGSGYSLLEYDAINLFRESGGIFIVAAGNCGDPNINYPTNECASLNQTFYPASYDLDNIISVSATDQNDNLASFSNYGLSSVDLGAPGTNIYSTSFDGSVDNPSYIYKSGTSMSTAYVSGLTALIWGSKPSLTATEIKNVILNTGDSLSSLNGKTATNKRINAFNALSYITTPPSASITYSDTDKIVKEGDSLLITANFNKPINDSPIVKISISGSNTVSATSMTKVTSTEYTYTHTVGSGNGTSNITLSVGTDMAGNIVTETPTSGETFTVDNIIPSNQDTVFATSITKKAIDTDVINIISSDDITNSMWFAPIGTTAFIEGTTMTKAVDGTSTSILAPSADGIYKLFIVDTALNISTSSIATLTVDNSLPTITISSPSSLATKTGPINYTITYAGADVVTLSDIDITLNTTGTVTGIVSLLGTGNTTRTITISDITGDGTLGITLASNTASDTIGNYALASGPSTTFIVDNSIPIAPVITSVATNNEISFEEKTAIHIIGTAEANSLVEVNLTDDVNTITETQQLSGGNTNYDIVVNSTIATPSGLINGTIHVRATAKNIVNDVSPTTTIDVTLSPKPRRTSSGGGGGGGPSVAPPINTPLLVYTNTPIPGCTDGALFSITTGKSCGIVNDNTPIPGCITGALFSVTTGLPCGTTNSNQLLTTPISTSPIIRVPFSLGINKILKLNTKGDDVKALQTYLNNLKYDCGIVDGIFGLKTKASVILFQKANTLIADGIVGRMTIGMMK